MFKEFFNLNLKQTFLSWTVMETLISILGLIGVQKWLFRISHPRRLAGAAESRHETN